MAPNAQSGVSGAPSAFRLRHARCLFHPLREAAALCPHCHGTFCRECVTDEDNQLACPPCLRKIARSPEAKPSAARKLRQAFAGVIVLACLATIVFLVLQWRVNRAESHMVFGFDESQIGHD
jgi:hypothetical protein